jgi:uncharacterized protein (TIGR00369 family)
MDVEEKRYDIPLHDHIGLTVENRFPRSRVSVPFSREIRGGVAPVHGGIVATLVDVACACALGDEWDPSIEIPVSTELNVRYFAQPKDSPIIAEGEVVHRGSRIVSVECVVRDGGGRQIARGTGSYMIVRGFGELADGPPRGAKATEASMTVSDPNGDRQSRSANKP